MWLYFYLISTYTKVREAIMIKKKELEHTRVSERRPRTRQNDAARLDIRWVYKAARHRVQTQMSVFALRWVEAFEREFRALSSLG